MKLSECQKRFWLDSVLYPDDSNNIGIMFCLRGKLDRDLLVYALNRAVQGTGAMRALYRRREDGELEREKAEGLSIPVEYVTEPDAEKCKKLADEFGRRLFDLEREMPVRMLLIRCSATTHRVVTAFHHICLDALSAGVFFSRWSGYYNGVPETEESEKMWKDYTVWEETHSNLKKEALSYWQHFFERMPLGMDLPGGRQFREGEFLDFRLGKKLQEEVKCLAADLHVTSFWVMLNAWMWTVAWYSGAQKAVVSYAVNIRPGRFKGLVGPFVNNLACGADLTDDPGFEETLKECIRQRGCTKKFQHVFLTDVAGALRKERILQGGEAFLNVGMNYAEWGNVEGFCLKGIRIKFERRVPTTPQFDLMLEVMPGRAAHSRIIYRKGIGKEFVGSMRRSFIRLLEQVCREPSVHFSEVAFLPDRRWTGRNLWEERMRKKYRHVIACFERRVRKEKERPALYIGERTVSYLELEDSMLRVACALRRRFREVHGKELLPGSPVGICMGRESNYIAAVLGILKAGGVYVPLDDSYPEDRLRFMAEDCGIELVVTTRKLSGRTGGRPELLLEEALAERPECRTGFPVPEPDDRAYIIYTSGTTGRPKGVPVSHFNLFCFMQNAFRFLRLVPGCRQLQYANISFDVSVSEIFPALVCGATICVASEEERRDPRLLIRRMRRMQVEAAYVAPVMLARLRGKLPHLRTLIVAGESTPAEALAYWKPGRRLLNGYGPTESTVYATLCEMEAGSPADDIGLPLQGVKCYVLDRFGRRVPEGVAGELYIGGCQLTEGYIGRPGLNREKFVRYPSDAGPAEGVRLYRTGDLVRRLPNGHLLFLGRMDFQVKIRGFRIELGEVESCLEAIEGVGQALVTVREEAGVKRLVAYVQGEFPEKLEKEVLRKELERLLPAYMMPSAFVCLKRFPVSPNGKVDRGALPAPEWEEKEYVAPVTVAEKLLAETAARILNTGRLSVEEDLFGLGLSSLDAVMLVSEAEKRGIKIRVSDVYREKTVRRTAAAEKEKVCHWLNGYREGCPVVILVCGHMDFGSLLLPFSEALSKKYTVLVVDSYHDYAGMLPEKVDFEGLLAFYERVLRKAVPQGARVYAFAGHCLGGEIAYALAARWTKAEERLPRVWLFNSRAERGKAECCREAERTDSAIQDMLWESAIRKKVLTDRLTASEVLPVYEGQVVLFTANEFTAYLNGPDLPAVTDRGILDRLRRAYRENEACWRRLAPCLTVKQVEGNHWTMLKEENIGPLLECF